MVAVNLKGVTPIVDSRDQHLQQDEYLKQLALTAQQHPRRSRERRQALTRLTQELLNSGRLRHPHPSQFTEHYQEIYEIAVQNLMLYICANIDKYNPDKAPVMRWVNFLLERRFFPEAVSEVLGKKQQEIKGLRPGEASSSLSDLVRQSIEEDYNGIFARKHIRGYPQANFKEIFRRRIIERESWEDISNVFEIKVSTLSDFYQRCIKQFSNEIKKQIQD
ncbi:hypothetical protein M595_1177 [Lyngbya aestuarii BL J]|uniref:Sigma-70 family RNA polymerase sigma factor n=1 Tax=Lyngbya aestuarii BL J TaxID=1348334 RepID=U7QLL7_9CYAN|nr:hypothetical protein M595_1177 [Lyngbya aestuarii BL J]